MSDAQLAFSGKTIALTGANRGLGHAMLVALLKRRPDRVIAYVRDENSVWESDVHEDARVELRFLRLDSAGDIAAAAGSLTDVDVLINNAAVCEPSDLMTQNPESIRREWEINFFAPLSLIQALARSRLPDRGFRVVNIGSKFVFHSLPVIGNYCATKAALWHATQAAAAIHESVQAQMICPGSLATEMGSRWRDAMDDPGMIGAKIVSLLESRRDMVIAATADAERLLAPLIASFAMAWPVLAQRSNELRLLSESPQDVSGHLKSD